MSSSKIEWTEHTWNVTVGCSRVSPGCDGCYAIGVAHRAMQPAHEGLTIKRPGERTDWTGVVRCLPERLEVPLRRRKPATFFVDSMSDLFHPEVPDTFTLLVASTMERCPQHVFQILTKRPQRMAVLAGWWWRKLCEDRITEPLPNVWLGTSIESDRYAFRADHLRATPAAVRFLSLEPLLGPLPSLDLTGIDWVIVGGESGQGARPMHPDWVRDIRGRCVELGIPLFVKQWGAWVPIEFGSKEWVAGARYLGADGRWLTTAESLTEPTAQFMQLVGKKAAGRELDGRTWDEMPARAS